MLNFSFRIDLTSSTLFSLLVANMIVFHARLLVSPAIAGCATPHPVRMRSGVRENYSDTPSRTRHPIVVVVQVVVVARTLDTRCGVLREIQGWMLRCVMALRGTCRHRACQPRRKTCARRA